MKRLFLLIVSLVIFSISSRAQYTREDSPTPENRTSSDSARRKPTASFWDRVSIGGGFGLQFGTYTFIGLSPLMSYHFSNNFIAGIGPIYQYFKYSDPNSSYTYSSSIYGGRIRALYFLPNSLSNLFLIGEYDVLNVPDNYSYFTNATRATITLPLLGLGLRRPIGDRAYFSIEGLWDFSNSQLSPYINPIIIGGIDVGI